MFIFSDIRLLFYLDYLVENFGSTFFVVYDLREL